MKTFKEMIRDDVTDIFLNPDEFGEPHTVNGKKMSASFLMMLNFSIGRNSARK